MNLPLIMSCSVRGNSNFRTFLVTLVLAAMSLCSWGQSLSIEPEQINADTIPLEDDLFLPKMIILKLTVKNTGKSVRNIESVSLLNPEGHWMQYLNWKMACSENNSIAPGHSDTLLLKLGYDFYEKNFGLWTKRFQVNSGSSSKEIVIHGNSSFVAIRGPRQGLPAIPEGTEKEFDVQIINYNPYPITLDSLRARPGNRVSLSINFPVSIMPGDTLKRLASISGKGLKGNEMSMLRIYYHHFNKNLDYSDLRISAIGIPNISLTNEGTATFNYAIAGEMIKEVICLKNNGSLPITLESQNCVLISKNLVNPGEETELQIIYNSQYDTGNVSKLYNVSVTDFQFRFSCTLKGIVGGVPDTTRHLFFEKTIHDFGLIDRKKTKSLKYIFRFKNVSNHPVIIYRAYASGGAMAFPSRKDPILPGEEAEIEFNARVSRRSNYHITVQYFVTDCSLSLQMVPLTVKAIISE